VISKPPVCWLCGHVGRLMWAKSTLLNHVLAQKLAHYLAQNPRPTRHTMLGIKTEGAVASIYVDTPGPPLPRTTNKGAQPLHEQEAPARRCGMSDVGALCVVEFSGALGPMKTRWCWKKFALRHLSGTAWWFNKSSPALDDKKRHACHILWSWLAPSLPRLKFVPVSALAWAQ